MGKKTKKPGKGKEKTERKTAKADEKKARREGKTLSPEDDIDAILLSIQKEGDEDEDEDDSEDEGNSEESDDEDDDEEAEAMDVDGSVKVGEVVAMIKGEGKSLRRKEKRAQIEQIRADLGLSDSQRTPVPGETLEDFYKRTNMYWQMAANEHTQHTGKELRKDGFDLAETRYLELKPILDELAILEAEQKAEEANLGLSDSQRTPMATETEWVEVSEDVENNVENNIENNVENNMENPEHLVMDDDEEVNHAKGMVMEDLELFRGFSSSMFLHAIESFESRGPHFKSNASYLTSLLDTMKMISYGMGDWIDYCFQKVDQEDDDMADDDAETEDDMADDDAETDDNIADYDEEYMADYDEVEYFYGRIKLAKRILKDIEKYGRMMFEMCPTLETLGEFRGVNRMLKEYIRATEQRDDDQKRLERIEDERAGDGRQLRGDWW